jgi:hypothetical protein
MRRGSVAVFGPIRFRVTVIQRAGAGSWRQTD